MKKVIFTLFFVLLCQSVSAQSFNLIVEEPTEKMKTWAIAEFGVAEAIANLIDFRDNNPITYGVTILHQADTYRISTRLIEAIVLTESAGKQLAQGPSAIEKCIEMQSSAGAVGAMGVKPIAAKHVGLNTDKETLCNISANIEAGVRYLHYLVHKETYGDMALAVIKYNTGPNTPILNTRYLQKVSTIKWYLENLDQL